MRLRIGRRVRTLVVHDGEPHDERERRRPRDLERREPACPLCKDGAQALTEIGYAVGEGNRREGRRREREERDVASRRKHQPRKDGEHEPIAPTPRTMHAEGEDAEQQR